MGKIRPVAFYRLLSQGEKTCLKRKYNKFKEEDDDGDEANKEEERKHFKMINNTPKQDKIGIYLQKKRTTENFNFFAEDKLEGELYTACQVIFQKMDLMGEDLKSKINEVNGRINQVENKVNGFSNKLEDIQKKITLKAPKGGKKEGVSEAKAKKNAKGQRKFAIIEEEEEDCENEGEDEDDEEEEDSIPKKTNQSRRRGRK